MAADLRQPRLRIAANADVDVIRVLFAEAPERRRTAVAQRGIGSAGENGCHPPALTRELWTPDRVDAAGEGVKPSGLHAVLDRARAEAEGK